MKRKLLFCAVYLACSFAAWGVMTGDFQCYHGDMNSIYPAAFVAVTGPAGLVAAVATQATDDAVEGKGFHFALRPFDRERRWRVFHARYPGLSRYYFDHGHQQADRCDCER